MDTRRVFFALWPDKETVELLAQRQAALELRGKPVVPANFHVTLAFIGAASPEYLACLHDAATKVSVKPFSLTLDTTGYFRKPRIAWVGPSHTPEPLFKLQQELVGKLKTCGYEGEERDYKPHVTLMRKAAPVETAEIEPVPWQVSAFALVESVPGETGPHYRVIETYSTSQG